MPLSQNWIEKLIFKRFQNNLRFTQDSPVYPDVWLDYFTNSANLEHRSDLILTPHRKSTAPELLKILSERLKTYASKPEEISKWDLATTGESVVARLTLDELVSVALPLTNWYYEYIVPEDKIENGEFLWLTELVGAIIYSGQTPANENVDNNDISLRNLFREYFFKHFDSIFFRKSQPEKKVVLWSMSRNRDAGITLEHSVPATKADAGRKLFSIDASELGWAILDTGIDANHLAFRKNDPTTDSPYTSAMGLAEDNESNFTRIAATYDFTRFRDILSEILRDKNVARIQSLINMSSSEEDRKLTEKEIDESIAQVEATLKNGRMLNWGVLSPLLRIPHNKEQYVPPLHGHGTHVAGIIGACQKKTSGSEPILGMCPNIDLYDIRVLDSNGGGKEFNILAALQFVRWMNNQREIQIINGVNLSFSMVHEVSSFACGQTPACVACDRLVAEGIIVVAAAGNLGQAIFQSVDGVTTQGFRIVNITDPGNAESIITVGATHRSRPHSYGVSYFSSKGPTGDGRQKPDLVAPGEKIVSCSIGGGMQRMDGTSMAAPHVSGAAALLLAKHRELIGRPRKVKEILCKTATDLGREKYFQGCGMVDVLRAIQSI